MSEHKTKSSETPEVIIRKIDLAWEWVKNPLESMVPVAPDKRLTPDWPPEREKNIEEVARYFSQAYKTMSKAIEES